MKQLVTAALITGTVLLLTGSAFAHPGHGATGFSTGILHPLSGPDHITAMLAVGLWATQLGKRAVWLVPAAFLTMMIAGAALAFAGLRIPFVEQGIAASVLVLGLMIVFALRMPNPAGMILVGAFALFHGWAHGHEMQPTGSALEFGIGFTLATIILHAVGIAFGLGLGRLKQNLWVRLAGVPLIGYAALLFMGAL